MSRIWQSLLIFACFLIYLQYIILFGVLCSRKKILTKSLSITELASFKHHKDSPQRVLGFLRQLRFLIHISRILLSIFSFSVFVCLSLHPLEWAHSLWRFLEPQTGPNGAKLVQTGANGAKWGQTGPNRVKWGQIGQIVAKQN